MKAEFKVLRREEDVRVAGRMIARACYRRRYGERRFAFIVEFRGDSTGGE